MFAEPASSYATRTIAILPMTCSLGATRADPITRAEGEANRDRAGPPPRNADIMPPAVVR